MSRSSNTQAHKPSVMACTCNPATWEARLSNGLSSSPCMDYHYVEQVSNLSIVSTWSLGRNSRCTRLDNEERTGPGRKRSRQKFPYSAVDGQH